MRRAVRYGGITHRSEQKFWQAVATKVATATTQMSEGFPSVGNPKFLWRSKTCGQGVVVPRGGKAKRAIARTSAAKKSPVPRFTLGLSIL